MSNLERYYTQHRDLVNVIVAAFIAGGVASNMYVTRDSAAQVNADLSEQIAGLAQKIEGDRALTVYRLDDHERRLAMVETHPPRAQ